MTSKHQFTVLMVVATSVAGDTRVLREAQALVEDGYRVEIIGKDIPADFTPTKGIAVHSATSGHGLRPVTMKSLASKRLPAYLRLLRWLALPAHRAKSFGAWASSAYQVAAEIDFDIVHAHDFTALELGSRLADEHKVPLIYDSHEWWVGRQRQYRPTPLRNIREASLEKRLVDRAAAVITVGDSIGELMRSQRGAERVFVVRNSFPDTGDTSSLVATPPKGIIYAGRIDAYRELEVTIDVAKKISLSICWMGESENQWATKWVPLARGAGIEVLPLQPLSAVTTAMQNAGLVFVTHSNRFESHRLAMPNKLFHAVQAGVPVIATDVSELASVVRKYDLGELYKPGNAPSMEAAIHRAIARHPELVVNVGAAKKELSWEKDEEILRGIYSSILGRDT